MSLFEKAKEFEYQKGFWLCFKNNNVKTKKIHTVA